MFPPQAHGPEQDVAQHLLRGSEQFAFGLVDDSFETRAVRDARRRLRPSSPRASRLHLAAVNHGCRCCHGSHPGKACSQGQRTQSCSLVARLALTVQLPGQLRPTWNKPQAPWHQVKKNAKQAQRLAASRRPPISVPAGLALPPSLSRGGGWVGPLFPVDPGASPAPHEALSGVLRPGPQLLQTKSGGPH